MSLHVVHTAGQMVLVPWKNNRFCFSRLEEVNFAKGTCLVRHEDNSEVVVPLADVRSADSSFARASACVVCKSQLSCPTNAIILCQTCHAGFHQQCHHPSISPDILARGSSWVCCYCKEGQPSPRGLCPMAKGAFLKSRKTKHEQMDTPATKRVLRRTINAELYRRCSLSDGESDRMASEYDTSGGSPSPGSSVVSLLPQSPGNQEKNNVQFNRPALSSETFKLKGTSKQCKHARSGESSGKETSGKQESGGLRSSAREGEHGTQTAPPSEMHKGREDIDEEEFIDVEGDGDNTADSDELEDTETDLCGSARTRGDVQRKPSKFPHNHPTTLPSGFVKSTSSHSTHISDSFQSSSKVTTPTLSEKNIQNSGGRSRSEIYPVTSLYAWVAKATANKSPRECDVSHQPTVSVKPNCSPSESHNQQRHAAGLQQANATAHTVSSKGAQKIAMPRLYDRTLNRSGPADASALSTQAENGSLALNLNTTHTSRQESDIGLSTNEQKKPPTHDAHENEVNETAPTVRQSCQSNDACSGGQLLKSFVSKDESCSVQLQNPFRHWVCSNAHQPKAQSQTPPPTPSQRPGTAVHSSRQASPSRRPGTALHSLRPATPSQRPGAAVHSSRPATPSQRPGTAIHSLRPATPSQKPPVLLKSPASPSCSSPKPLQRPSSLSFSKTGTSNRKHNHKAKMIALRNKHTPDSWEEYEPCPPKEMLIHKVAAGFLAQPLDLRMPWQVSQENKRKLYIPDQLSKDGCPSHALTVQGLFDRGFKHCKICKQNPQRRTILWLEEFVEEYRKFMARWE